MKENPVNELALKLQKYQDMQKNKHYEILENVEKLIKEGDDRIAMTQNEFLLNMRTLHNENLRSLKETKDDLQTKLNKLTKAHQL
jgi:hypothetical protein